VVVGQHVTALMDRWVCHLSDCGNGSGWCYVSKDVHLTLLAQHLQTWSIGINNSTDAEPVDLETPPKALAESLKPAKRGKTNPLVAEATKPPPSPAPLQYPPLPPFHPAVHPMYPLYPYPNYPPYQQQLPPPPYALPAQPTAPVHPPTTMEATQLRSSPIMSDSEDSNVKLDEYFAWLTKLNPSKADGLAKCLQAFKDEDIVIGMVDKVENQQFDSWAVSTGIRILVKTYVSKWLHAKAKGRA
jgi:hypothetical protein